MFEIAPAMRLLILIRGYFEAEIGASMKLSKGASRVTEHWATGFVFMSVTMECFCFKVPSNQELAMEGEREREVPPCPSSLPHVTDCIIQDIPKRFANGHDVSMACSVRRVVRGASEPKIWVGAREPNDTRFSQACDFWSKLIQWS